MLKKKRNNDGGSYRRGRYRTGGLRPRRVEHDRHVPSQHCAHRESDRAGERHPQGVPGERRNCHASRAPERERRRSGAAGPGRDAEGSDRVGEGPGDQHRDIRRHQATLDKFEGGTAIADFSKEILGYGGGSARVQEIMAQIDNTVTSNDSSVKNVSVTVEGKPSEETLQP